MHLLCVLLGENGQALQWHTGHETWPDLSSKIGPRDREICGAMALAVDPNHIAANGLELRAYFAPWKAADVTARVFSSQNFTGFIF
jgi:hypothetical protein